MSVASMRILAATAGVAVLVLSANPTVVAQSADPKAGSQRAQGAETDGPKKTDEYSEAAKLLGSPAGNPECVWLGRRAVNLLIRDDLDTAFRHMELYDRFGCPPGHIQMAFRCVIRQGNPDIKAPDTLSGRIHACWISPVPDVNGPPPSAAAPATTTNR